MEIDGTDLPKVGPAGTLPVAKENEVRHAFALVVCEEVDKTSVYPLFVS